MMLIFRKICSLFFHVRYPNEISQVFTETELVYIYYIASQGEMEETRGVKTDDDRKKFRHYIIVG